MVIFLSSSFSYSSYIARFTVKYGDFIKKAYQIHFLHFTKKPNTDESIKGKLNVIKQAIILDDYMELNYKLSQIEEHLQKRYYTTQVQNRAVLGLSNTLSHIQAQLNQGLITSATLSRVIEEFNNTYGLQKKGEYFDKTNEGLDASSLANSFISNSGSPLLHTQQRSKPNCLCIRLHRILLDSSSTDNLSLAILYGREKRTVSIGSQNLDYEAEFSLYPQKKAQRFVELVVYNKKNTQDLSKVKTAQIDLLGVPVNTVHKMVVDFNNDASVPITLNNAASEIELTVFFRRQTSKLVENGVEYDDIYKSSDAPSLIPEFSNVNNF